MTLFELTATAPQHWICHLCGFRYESPLPLQHAPNHRCRRKGSRILKMELEQ